MNLDSIEKLSRAQKLESSTLSRVEARYLVNSYYQIQDYRKTAFAQERELSKDTPNEADVKQHQVISWLAQNMETFEKQIIRSLDTYSESTTVGRWSRSVIGIGPVIAAGLIAHIDIEKAPTVGHIWRFAGLDPTSVWNKGEKRPWNADLKVLCWKIGESFVKVCNKDDAFYGNIYQVRKEKELVRNENLEFKKQAEEKLAKFKIGKDTDAYQWYSQGKLPPAHIHARSKRYAVKLFLAHWHHIAYIDHYKKEPPSPYPIAMLGHAHYIAPPL